MSEASKDLLRAAGGPAENLPAKPAKLSADTLCIGGDLYFSEAAYDKLEAAARSALARAIERAAGLPAGVVVAPVENKK